jgi:hypothetical protein
METEKVGEEIIGKVNGGDGVVQNRTEATKKRRPKGDWGFEQRFV